jgi:plastocyanin
MRRRVAILVAIGLAFTCLLPLDARSTAVVTGNVRLTSVRGAPMGVSVYGRRGVAPRQASVGPETRKVVVYLEGARPGAAPPAMHARVRQRGEQFEPAVTVVTTGSTVDFPNDDPYFHNVFSLSRTATFDLGRYPTGTSRVHRFQRPGIVKVFCHIHAQMSALVMVLDHPWFSIPEETGSFTLPDVPTGDYTLVAWHERIGERREPIRLTPGATVRVEFTLPVLESEP